MGTGCLAKPIPVIAVVLGKGFRHRSNGTTDATDRPRHDCRGHDGLWTARFDGNFVQPIRHTNLVPPGRLWEAMRYAQSAHPNRNAWCHCLHSALFRQLPG
jgi:hypothetical protein